MGLSVLSDISVRASSRVIKNSTRDVAEFAIFNNETGKRVLIYPIIHEETML